MLESLSQAGKKWNVVDREVFEKLKAEGYQRVPVYRSILADLDTPLSVYLKLVIGRDCRGEAGPRKRSEAPALPVTWTDHQHVVYGLT